jgi:hypothetical protein
LHVVWLSDYCHPAAGLKQKTHRRPAVGLIKFSERSKPVCRAGQQRVVQQQVQVTIHGVTLTGDWRWVKWYFGGTNPKTEIRNPKEIRSLKSETGGAAVVAG